MVINDSESFAAMVDGVEEITNIIARCAVFEAVYLKQPTSATIHLKASLVALYASVLMFLDTAYTYFGKSATRRFFKSQVEPAAEIENALERVTAKQNVAERVAQMVSMEILQNTSTRMQDLTSMVGNLSM